MPKQKSSTVRCLLIALFIFALDQASKAWVTYGLGTKKIAVIPFLNFHLSHNKGAAFGMLADSSGWQRWFFISVAIVISIILIHCVRRLRNSGGELFAYALILGGAWGNLVDRILYGHVIDFIDFYVGSWHWYTFNVADIAICVGASNLLLYSFKSN